MRHILIYSASALFPASALLALSLASTGCLDPLVEDEPIVSSHLVLPADSDVPSAHDDPDIEARIAAHDGVDGVVQRLSAFAKGGRVWYWDFGVAPDRAVPIFRLVRRHDKDGEVEAIDHRNIVGLIPGDENYSAFWGVFQVEVTERYNGELITSLAALDQARQLGLVGSPQFSGKIVNCPIVSKDVTLEIGEGRPNIPPGQSFYWDGQFVYYYSFESISTESSSISPTSSVYKLARSGEPPLSEVERGVDMTSDGDLADTNNIFANKVGDNHYTSLSSVVRVTVDNSYQSIDSNRDETMAAATAENDLFTPMPVPGVVLAVVDTGELHNLPQQSPDAEP